jgi:Rieske Fe-S protein
LEQFDNGKMTEEYQISRGSFINITTKLLLSLAGILGLGGLVRYFSLSPDHGSVSRFELGAPEDYPLGSRIFRSDIPAIIIHGNDGIMALSLSCTHLGCALEELENELSCPCHGSRFDQNGHVLSGPADQDLPHLDIELSDEGILVLSTKRKKK